jgi:DNA-binding XRE family transcriptional regulator
MAPSPTAVKRKERRAEWIETNPLRVWRHKQGLAMMDVASMLGVAFSGVQSHEQGGYKPSEPTMKKYAAMMHQSYDSLDRAWDAWTAKGQSLR